MAESSLRTVKSGKRLSSCMLAGLSIVTVWLLVGEGMGWCGEPDSLSSVRVEAAENQDSYILDAGDEIVVEDATVGLLTEEQVRIADNGQVDLPLIGSIHLAGLPLDAAQVQLNREFHAYLVDPAITIRVLYQHPPRVYVQGAVNKPGVYISGKTIQPDGPETSALGTSDADAVFHRFYLTDALIQAGGLKPEADYADIRVHRYAPYPQTLHVNLWELFQGGNIAQDIPLQERDMVEVVSVPKNALVANQDWLKMTRSNIGMSLFKVNVIGAVRQPGSYEVSAKDNILAAIAQAGGFSQMANQRAVYLLRSNGAGQVFKKRIDASDPKLMGKGQPDWAGLLPGDVVFVDDSRGRQASALGRTLTDRATSAALWPLFSMLLGN